MKQFNLFSSACYSKVFPETHSLGITAHNPLWDKLLISWCKSQSSTFFSWLPDNQTMAEWSWFLKEEERKWKVSSEDVARTCSDFFTSIFNTFLSPSQVLITFFHSSQPPRKTFHCSIFALHLFRFTPSSHKSGAQKQSHLPIKNELLTRVIQLNEMSAYAASWGLWEV